MQANPLRMILVAFLLSTVFARLNADSYESGKLAILQGNVTNVSGLPVSKAKISFESTTFFLTTEADDTGYFKVALPAGIYQLSIDKWIGHLSEQQGTSDLNGFDCQSYFRPAIRARIRATEGENTTVNFALAESGILCDYNPPVKPGGGFESLSHGELFNKVQYETLHFNGPLQDFPREEPLEMVIQYGGYRKERKDIISYALPIYFDRKGNNLSQPLSGLVITYDNITIYAKVAWINRKTHVMYISGNVNVEDGKQRYAAKEITITLNSAVPIMKIRRE